MFLYYACYDWTTCDFCDVDVIVLLSTHESESLRSVCFLVQQCSLHEEPRDSIRSRWTAHSWPSAQRPRRAEEK